MPPSLSEVNDGIKTLLEAINDGRLFTEIKLINQKLDQKLELEKVQEIVKTALNDREKATSKWAQPVINIVVVIITTVIVSFIMKGGN